MVDIVRRYNLLLASSLLIIISFQLMGESIDNRELPQLGARALQSVFLPFQKLHHEASETTSYYWNHYLWLMEVEQERVALTERVGTLEAELSKIRELAHENERLRSLLSYTKESGIHGVAASVIGRDPSNWIQTITIDRGTEDGLARGMPVVDGHAVVGQTIVVSARSAKVLLVTDNASAIDALVQPSRAGGTVEGAWGDELRLRYVQKEYSVSLGDRVVASGLDGVFPKGTLIGEVVSVEDKPGGLFREVKLHPAVDINRLENVLVLTPELAPREEGEPSA